MGFCYSKLSLMNTVTNIFFPNKEMILVKMAILVIFLFTFLPFKCYLSTFS